MKPPCMVVVKYILPSIRALVARSLVEEYNMKPIKVASKMDITPAAVTQYMKGVRGIKEIGELEESEKVKESIRGIVEALFKENVDEMEVLEKMCEACKTIKKEEILCKLHREEFNFPKNKECDFCYG